MRAACFMLAVGFFVAAGRADEAPSLHVMTFNLRYATAADGQNAWLHRKPLVAKTILGFEPDLLGTQEVLATQADFLVEQLPGYSFFGVGRDDGKRGGEFSPVLVNRSRFETVDSGTFWLSETPDRPGSKSWDSALPRVATWVKLRDHAAANRELCYLNTHWDHRGKQARRESAKLTRRWLAKHAQGLPTIVTGDLNVTEDHEAYKTLVAEKPGEARLLDVYRQVHPETGRDEATFHNFTGNRQGRRIDFIFASPEFTASEAHIVTAHQEGLYPSDHFPVTAVLFWAIK